MIEKSKLSISIHEAEFSKDFQYFINVQCFNQKKQTDISALVRNPIFTNNTLIFELPSSHTLQGVIIFVAHMIMEENEPGSSNKQAKKRTKILGDCSLDLSPFALQPTETYNLPIRQQLKFIRMKEGREISVGRFIASIKIVKEDSVPSYIQELQNKKIERNQYYSQLPDFDETMSFNWRVRVEVREALNIPSTEGITPQVFVDVGWTEYKDILAEQKRIYTSSTLNTNDPQWNQTFLITNPSHINDPKGYILISMKDNHNLEDIFRIYVPVESMGIFVPYNIRTFKEGDNVHPVQFYFSLILQTPFNKRDRLFDIIVSDITFEPMVIPFKSINIATVLNSQNEPKIKFYTFDPKQDSIQRVLQFDQAEQFNYIMSQTMRVPPIKSSKRYRAATVVTLSESLLKKKISFYLIGKTDKGNYKIAGLAQAIQKDLIALLIEKIKKKLFLSVRNHPNVKMGNCQLQISQVPENLDFGSSRVSGIRGQQTASERLMKQLNFTSNDSMMRHITQNNQIIARILRDLDDKSESLKQAAAEISDLRGRVKLLQNENSILRKNQLRQQDELVNLVQRQIESMSIRDLKEKIIKISQLYKGEKIKCRELDKTIKVMEPQISNTMQLNSIIVSQKNAIQNLNDKIEKMAKDGERINIYKQTIKKQEKVIGKLQRVMKQGMEQVRNSRKIKIQLEQLKRKGENTSYRGSSTSQREQIVRLQGIIAQLQGNNKTMDSSSFKNNGQNGSNYELQFKLHQAETRISSLEEELQDKSRTYGRQLAMLRMRLAEKQAVMDGYMR